MEEKGDKPKTGNRATTAQARELEPSDDARLVDRVTRERKFDDPSPKEQLKLLESYRWEAIARAANAMEDLPVKNMFEAEALIRLAEKFGHLQRNLESTVATMQEAAVSTQYEELTDEQAAMYKELYPELYATAPTPDGPAS